MFLETHTDRQITRTSTCQSTRRRAGHTSGSCSRKSCWDLSGLSTNTSQERERGDQDRERLPLDLCYSDNSSVQRGRLTKSTLSQP